MLRHLRWVFLLSALLPVANISAQTYIRLYSVGLRAGIYPSGQPEGNVPFFGFQAEVGHFEPDLRLELRVEGYHSEFTKDMDTSDEEIDKLHHEVLDISVAGILRYDIPFLKSLQPYVGVGPDLHVVDYEFLQWWARTDTSEIEYWGPHHTTYSTTIWRALGGLRAPLGSRLSLSAEFNFLTNYDNYSLAAGLTYRLRE